MPEELASPTTAGADAMAQGDGDALPRFAATMGRRYRAVLAVIAGHLDVALELLEADHPAARDAPASRIATEELSELTRLILAFGRSAPLNPTVTDLNDIVAEVAVRLRPTLPPTVDMVIDLASGGCPALVDRAQLRESIANLVMNALEGLPVGTLRIGTARLRVDATYVRRHPAASIGHHVAVAVSDVRGRLERASHDRGPGPRLTTAPAPGAEFGLLAVRGFVEQSGGHLTMTSKAGIGTTVRIVLPRAG